LNVNVVDTKKPGIWFDINTALSGNQTADSIAVNVSASDLHLANITVNLFDASGLLASSTSAVQNPFFVNFTGLSDGIYNFNATAYDSSGNSNSTETRTVVIDNTMPVVIDLNVTPTSIFMTQSVAISVNVTDLSLESVIARITLPDSSVQNINLAGSGNIFSTVYSNTAQNGTYNVRIIAEDAFGNINNSENEDFVVNYAVRTIINSNIYGEFYPNNFTYDVRTTNVGNSSVVNSNINGAAVNVSNSIIENSTLTDVTVINYCQVYNSVVIGGTCDHVYIDPSNLQNSITTGSTIIDSNLTNSNATYSSLNNSVLNGAITNNSGIINGNVLNSEVVDSNVTGSTLRNSSISDGSHVENSHIENVTATNAVLTNTTLGDRLSIDFADGTIIGDTVYNGTFSYNGVSVDLNAVGNRTFVYLINYAPSATLIVSSASIYVGDSIFLNASGSTDPNMVNGSNIALTFTEQLNYTFVYAHETLGTIEVTNLSETTHAFASAGNYTVYVVVTDAFGRTSQSAGYSVHVSARPTSGGGGGGGGSCHTDWVCTSWSSCENGIQTRTCAKEVPRCYANGEKPAESMSCETEPAEGDSNGDGGFIQEIGSKITGAVTGAFGSSRMKIAWIFILAILAAGGILWLSRRKKALGKKEKSRRK
jgi:uncharacterized protein YjbI with pentapeptide repeats